MTPAEIALLGGPAPWLGKDRISRPIRLKQAAGAFAMPRFTLFKRDPVQFPPTRITAGLFPPERVLAPREKEAPAQHSTFILTVLATFIFGFGLAALFFCLMNFLSTALPNTLSSGSRDASAPNQPKSAPFHATPKRKDARATPSPRTR